MSSSSFCIVEVGAFIFVGTAGAVVVLGITGATVEVAVVTGAGAVVTGAGATGLEVVVFVLGVVAGVVVVATFA